MHFVYLTVARGNHTRQLEIIYIKNMRTMQNALVCYVPSGRRRDFAKQRKKRLELIQNKMEYKINKIK